MNTVSKALLGTVAAGAMAVTSASPAAARDRHSDGISAGDVIAGAVILGGIAAIATSIGKDRGRGDYRNDQRYDQRYRDNYYQSRGNPRSAVQLCVAAAQQNAARYGFRGARVTEIRKVDDTRNGWRVKGRIAVNDDQRYNSRDRYGYRDQRGYRQDARYNNSRYGYTSRSKDHGSFSCDIQRGRVVDIDYDGIRGLR